jgi:hypothetical protein
LRIISASRRTDLPAFYSRWFLNRIRAGFCHWINPFSGQVSRVSLRPEDVLAIGFWTRDPRPLLPHLDLLRSEGYRFYFHITINGYPPSLESHSPPVEDSVDAFRRLAEAIAPWPVFWRYDPIILSSDTPVEHHLRRFEEISGGLAGHTERCYFSFLSMYGKTRRNLEKVRREHGVAVDEATLEERMRVAGLLRDVAAPRGITLHSCSTDELAGSGIRKGACLDLEVVEGLGAVPDRRLRPAPTRPDCGCVEATDIGAYDACAFGCAYCYATTSRDAALRRLRSHDPEDTVLHRPASLVGVDLATREGPKVRRGTVASGKVGREAAIPGQMKLSG